MCSWMRQHAIWENCRRAMSVDMMLCRVFFPQRGVATATGKKITWRLQPDWDRVILVRTEICDDWTCQTPGERLQDLSDLTSSSFKLFNIGHLSGLNQKSPCINNKVSGMDNLAYGICSSHDTTSHEITSKPKSPIQIAFYWNP